MIAKRSFQRVFDLSRLLRAVAAVAFAQPATAALAGDGPRQPLFINVDVFDGASDALAVNRRVLVEGNLIKSVGDGTTVIDGGG